MANPTAANKRVEELKDHADRAAGKEFNTLSHHNLARKADREPGTGECEPAVALVERRVSSSCLDQELFFFYLEISLACLWLSW